MESEWKVGQRIFVDYEGKSWEARISSLPEYGWVGVRGIYIKTGVISVPARTIRRYEETISIQEYNDNENNS